MATTPRSAGNPVRLDPFQRIIAVAWGGDTTITVQYKQAAAGSVYGPASMSSIPGVFDALLMSAPSGETLNIGTPPVPYVVKNNPFVNVESVETLSALLQGFITIKPRLGVPFLIDPTSYTFSVVAPSVGEVKSFPGGTIYWLWGDQIGATSFADNLAHPYTTGDPFSGFPITDPRSIMFLPRPFATEGERSPYLGVGGGAFHPFEELFSGGTVTHDGLFNVTVSTYRKRTTFPVNARNEPTFDTGEAINSLSRTRSGVQSGRTYTFHINFATLEITEP